MLRMCVVNLGSAEIIKTEYVTSKLVQKKSEWIVILQAGKQWKKKNIYMYNWGTQNKTLD